MRNVLQFISCADKAEQEKQFGSKHWYVALDAAAFVPTSPLNLAEFQADFVCMSFYKMFGFPTGKKSS